MRKRTAIAPCIATALAIAIARPGAAAQEHGRSSLAVLDCAVSDRSPLPDAAATRAQLAASGKTPAQWLAQALASFDAWQLVDPARVAAVQNDCSAAPCALAAGKSLGASRVVYGTVIKVSRLIWYADAALVDVAAGKVLRSEELEIKGDIVQLLPRAMPAMAPPLAIADPRLAKLRLDPQRLTAEPVRAVLSA